MKKFTVLLAVLATFAGTAVNAQTNNNSTMGKGAKASTRTNSDNWAWGIGLGGLAVIGTIIGLSVAGGTTSQPTGSVSH